MKSTIVDLWNGEIAPCEHCGSHDPRLNQLLGLREKHSAALRRDLTPEQKVDFQKYNDYSEDYLFRMMELAFCEGFSLGGKLAAEALL